MSLATREQKAVMTDFAGDGRFLQLFHAMKKLREKDLKKNTNEQLRLRTAVEYNYKCVNVHSKYLLNRMLFWESTLLISIVEVASVCGVKI